MDEIQDGFETQKLLLEGLIKRVGLTNDPEQARQHHGNPADWMVFPFETELKARNWHKFWILQDGYQGDAELSNGWNFGFVYTISPSPKK